MIFTNKLCYEIDYVAMNRDFFCIKVTGSRWKKGEPALPVNLIQQIADICQPVCVMHQFGNNMYILLNKNGTQQADILDKLQRMDDYRERGLCFAPIVFTSKAEESFETHLTGYWVLQLLLNTLTHNNPHHPNPDYQNLYGKLFVPVPGGSSSCRHRDVFELSVDRQDLLSIEAHRFAAFDSIESLSKWRQYNSDSYNVFFVENKTSRTFTRSIDPYNDIKKHGIVYVNHPYYTKELVSVPFINTESVKKFNQSRIGMYVRFITEVKALLGEYILRFEQLPMPERDYEHISAPELPIEQRVKEYYSMHGLKKINLLDHCRNDESAGIKEFLNHYAAEYNLEIHEIDQMPIPGDDMPVFSIVHNEDFYKDHKEDDPHNKGLENIIQHVTAEDFIQKEEDLNSFAAKAKFLVLLRDLAIKRDLKQGRADFLAVNNVEGHHQYSFNMVKGFGTRNKKPMDIYSIRIHDDFSITTKHSEDKIFGFDISLSQEIDEITKKLRIVIKNNPEFEGWVENEEGERNFIYRTNEIVMPELSLLKEQIQSLERELPEELQEPKAMVSIVKQLFAEEPSKVEAEKLDELVSRLKAEKLLLTKSKLKTILKSVLPYQSSAYRHLARQFKDVYGILFAISRGKEAHDLHEYRAGLRYWEDNGIGFYFSGEWDLSGLRATKARADHIRAVVPDKNSSLFFRKLLPGMNEEIVHLAARSVLPAGFKYVREYTAKAVPSGTVEDAMVPSSAAL